MQSDDFRLKLGHAADAPRIGAAAQASNVRATELAGWYTGNC
jgi:hypothetical protein